MDLITFKVRSHKAKNANYLHVCPSMMLSASLPACIGSASSGWIFVKFDVGDSH
jgi:hypothetical protein